jgi:eukaryotic-like serine/threonine-protein kinase
MSRDTESGSAANDDATVVGRPGARPRSSPPDSGVRLTGPSSAQTDASQPNTIGSSRTGAGLNEVLEAEEATRAHGFSAAMAMVSLSFAPFVPWLGGDPVRAWSCVAALVVMGLTSSFVWRRTRPDAMPRYRRNLLRMHDWVLATGVTAVELWAGFFSPVPVVLTLGIYYFGQSVDRLYSWLLPSVVVAVYVVLALLTAFGFISDVTLFPAATTFEAKIFGIVAASAVLVFSATLARLSRRALHQAIDASTSALLLAQQRSAQLAEANHQLDRALRAAVGKPGRYSGLQAGDHTLGLVIGVGAMGEVYEAQHVRSSEAVAVKLLQGEGLERPDLVERFLREGEIARSIDSPHVARVHAVGRMANGAPFLTMDLLRGRDLASRLRQEGQLSIPELIRLATHVAAALENAHRAGVVHRDLKPLNVYEAEQDGTSIFKVLDFGVSKIEGSTGTLTQEGVVGTPGYMSPEQARGRSVDRRSDVFSMGVLLYRAATGQPAFTGPSTPQIMFDIVYKSPLRPSSIVRELSRDVDLVFALALAKDPDQRFQSAAELATAFSEACNGGLPPAIKARAVACLRAQPWGKAIAELARSVES